jgi:hypothetical protein
MTKQNDDAIKKETKNEKFLKTGTKTFSFCKQIIKYLSDKFTLLTTSSRIGNNAIKENTKDVISLSFL